MGKLIKVSICKIMMYGVGNDGSFSLLFSLEGLVNKILSARFWIPLSRLTYCAYLVHIIALIVLLGTYETTQAYSDVHIVSNLLENSHEFDLFMARNTFF